MSEAFLRRIISTIIVPAVLVGLLLLLIAKGLSLTMNIPGSGSLGGWQYQYSVAAEEYGDYEVTYDCPLRSAADVQAAVAALNQAADQLAANGEPFKVTLVFARPLPPDEFITFARGYGIAPTGSLVRAVDARGGPPITAGIPPEWARDGNRFLTGQPNPDGAPLDPRALTNIQGSSRAGRLVGVYATDVTVDAAIYARLKQDGRVYAFDVLPQILTATVQRRHLGLRPPRVQVRTSLLYPAMERFGLVQQP